MERAPPTCRHTHLFDRPLLLVGGRRRQADAGRRGGQAADKEIGGGQAYARATVRAAAQGRSGLGAHLTAERERERRWRYLSHPHRSALDGRGKAVLANAL